jgi:hypothetical protein
MAAKMGIMQKAKPVQSHKNYGTYPVNALWAFLFCVTITGNLNAC